MGIFNHHLEGNSLVIDMPKCLDATNAPEADAEIQAICEEYPDRNAVLDCKVLDYISSAGLRVILRLKQMHKSVSSIINVSPTVYEILDCTGFSEMFEVRSWAEYLRDYLPEMQYRKISRMIEEVPDDSRIVHGDFYIRNIMYQNKECLLIDMDTLSSGNPIFEFGSIYNAYRGFYEIRPAECETFLGISSEMAAELWQKTLACYFEGADEEFLGRIEKSAMLLGHIRLLRRAIKRGGDNSEEQQKMAAHSRERIRELLEELDAFAVVN